jgi:hypothetical protein
MKVIVMGCGRVGQLGNGQQDRGVLQRLKTVAGVTVSAV